jgi:hypothetical protein
LINPLRARAIIGALAILNCDRQLARLDFAALGAASPVAKTLWLPDMNHVLIDVADEADDVAAYDQPERALDTVLIDSVADFVLANGVR